MYKMRFSGLPAGTADVTVRHAGQTSSLNTTIPAEPLSAERNCFFLQTEPKSTAWEGMSVTTSEVEGQSLGNGMYPPVYREVYKVTSGHANRIIASAFSDHTFTEEIYVGGTADVYRVRNGRIEEIRQSRITGGNWGTWHERLVVSTPGYNQRFASWNGRGQPYWFGVAAIDGTNKIGAIADIAYDLPEGASGAEQLSNDNVAGIAWEAGGSLAAPTGLTIAVSPSGPDGLHLDWNPVANAVGYVVFIAYADPASFVPETYLELEDDGGAPVLEGDMVILTHRIMAPKITMKSARVHGEGITSRPLTVTPIQNALNVPGEDVTSSFADWTAEDPAPDPALGTSYARIHVTAGVGSAKLMQRFWSGPQDQSFYTVPQTDQMFRWSAWIEVDRTTTFNLSFGLPGVSDTLFSLNPGWHKVVFERSPSEPSGATGRPTPWILSVTDRATPANIRVAGLRFHDVATEFHHLPKPLAELVTPGMYLRDHSLIKPGTKTTDVAALTNPPGESPRETTLEGFLRACDAVGGLPWLQIEWYHTEADWLDILAYLAAPVSSGHPMALKRQSNGRTLPWVDAFDGLRLEFGNESWNGLDEFWNPPGSMTDAVTGEVFSRGQIFGLLCRRAVEAMQASPYWSDKIKIVLGGWAGHGSYSYDIAEAYGLPVEIGIANYNGGWDVGNVIVSENQESYQNAVAVVPASTRGSVDQLVDGLKALSERPDVALTFGETLRPTCYEAGPGYQLNGLNGAAVTDEEAIVQEVVMKSRAVGTGTLESMLYQAASGFALFNYFTLSEGNNWSARASGAQGGGVFPSYALCRVVQEQMGPCSVYSFNELRADTIELVARDNETITPSQAFAYGLQSLANPRRLMFVVGNRGLDTAIPLSLLSTLRSCEELTAWANIGPYAEHNRYPVGQRLAAEGGFEPDANCVDIRYPATRLPVPSDPARIDIDASLGLPGLENGIPPGGAVILQLDGAVF